MLFMFIGYESGSVLVNPNIAINPDDISSVISDCDGYALVKMKNGDEHCINESYKEVMDRLNSGLIPESFILDCLNSLIKKIKKLWINKNSGEEKNV